MKQTINLNFGLEIEIIDTEFGLSHDLINHKAKMKQPLGIRRK